MFLWSPKIEEMLVQIVVELDPSDTWIHSVFSEPLWELITQTLNERTGIDFVDPNVIRRFGKIVRRLIKCMQWHGFVLSWRRPAYGYLSLYWNWFYHDSHTLQLMFN